jgi:hypothetical protein
MEMEIEQRKLDLEEKRIDQATDLAQIEVNKIEAAPSVACLSLAGDPQSAGLVWRLWVTSSWLYPLVSMGVEILTGYGLGSCWYGTSSCA